MKLLLALLASAAAAVAAEGPRVVFTKSFPGSVPAYVAITVDRGGSATYKETADDDPETFKIEPDAAAAIFDLAEKLEHFKNPLESGLKVAKMGDKTFRWDDGAQSSEAKFNYSLDENARLLQDWFERIGDGERLLITLRRAVRYDKLGVHDTLLKIEALWIQKRLVGRDQFLPLLDRVAQNDTFLHMARERAAQLAEAFRAAAKAKTP
jgi:hypothetical protein